MLYSNLSPLHSERKKIKPENFACKKTCHLLSTLVLSLLLRRPSPAAHNKLAPTPLGIGIANHNSQNHHASQFFTLLAIIFKMT